MFDDDFGYRESRFPFSEGHEFTMEFVGNAIGSEHKEQPFGWCQKVRMIVDDRWKDDAINVYPGEIATVRVTGLDHNHAHVSVLENHGPFLDKFTDTNRTVKITGMSNVDARDAVSDPRYKKGGIVGVPVVIEKCKYFKPSWEDMEPSFREADVVIQRYTKGKHGYIMFSKPASYEEDLPRKPKEDIFFSTFYSFFGGLDFDRLHEKITGVPKRNPPGIVLFIDPEGDKKILFRTSEQDLSDYDMGNAILYFMDRLRDDTFPLALMGYRSEDEFQEAAREYGKNPIRLLTR
ncbi:MAG: hypothetical protein JW754_02275 [Candidatus Aenigmarchaeota archaeon]|nr:hypothetical protein [Candidatus Aenigmarchaeota archaeon]